MGLKRGWVKKIFSEFKKELPDIVKDFQNYLDYLRIFYKIPEV